MLLLSLLILIKLLLLQLTLLTLFRLFTFSSSILFCILNFISSMLSFPFFCTQKWQAIFIYSLSFFISPIKVLLPSCIFIKLLMLPRSNKLHSMLVKYSSLSLSLSYSPSGFSFCHFYVLPFSFCLFFNTTFFILIWHYWSRLVLLYIIHSTILFLNFQ